MALAPDLFDRRTRHVAQCASADSVKRLGGAQAERYDGDLPFASRLMALLPMTGHWAAQAFFEGEIPFSGVAQTVGFGLGRSKMLYLSTGID
jgi:hypothetical protein